MVHTIKFLLKIIKLIQSKDYLMVEEIFTVGDKFQDGNTMREISLI
jgi:hypothetical protein